MNRLPMATPRGRSWSPHQRPSRWRPVLGGLAWFVIVLLSGLSDVRF